MFSRLLDVGADIAAFGQRLWQIISRPVFDVKIIRRTTGLTAGQRQDICTIEISLPENHSVDPREQIEFPRPSLYLLTRDGSRDLSQSILDEVLTQNRRKLTILVFGHLTVSGYYTVSPMFPETSRIRLVGRHQAEFEVQPSRPASLKIIKVNPLSGDCLNFYKGGRAEIFVKVTDQYGNVVKDIEVDVQSSHVTLYSRRFDSGTGCHVLIVDCNKEGRAILSLTSGPLAQLQHSCLDVIPAPLYPANCLASRTEKGRVLAGQVVKWKLQLYDICNHPYPLKDGSSTSEAVVTKIGDERRVDDETSRKEESSLKLIPSGTDVCHLEWKPLIAGSRSIAVLIDGIEICNHSLQIDVEPGPLVDLIVEFGRSPRICYPTDKVVTLEGLDAYGNNVVLNPLQWCLESSGEGLQQEVIEDGKRLDYSFDLPGRYVLGVKSTDDSLSHIKVPDPFSVEIASPLVVDQCSVRKCSELPIFEKRLTIDVILSPCTGVSYQCIERLVRFLEVKVDDKPVLEAHLSRRCSYSKNSCKIDIRNLEYGVGKTVEVLYCGKTLGKKMKVDLEGVLPFEISDYIVELESSKTIRCDGVPMATLKGADKANIDNINRVLDGESRLTMDKIKKDEQQPHLVYFYLRDFDKKSVDDVYELLGLLVEGFHHYRKQAYRFGDKRRKWKEKAELCEYDYQQTPASECKAIKKKYGDLMNECHEKASDCILEFYNYERHESEIDLHGQRVANEENLEDLRNKLLDRIIQSIREKNDEAIRHLRSRLESFDHEKAQREERDWLEIIVGAGHHSDDKRQKIRPKVEELLEKKDIEYIECNPGSLLITFTEYSGEEPCMANFLCQNCHRSWESTTSWKGMFQRCYKCDRKGTTSKCYPFKLRSPSTSKSYHRRGEGDFTRRDHRRLCQKCIELGRDCSAA